MNLGVDAFISFVCPRCPLQKLLAGRFLKNKYIMCLPNSYVIFLLCIVLVCHEYGEYVLDI